VVKAVKPANRTVMNIFLRASVSKKMNHHESDRIELKAQTYSCFVNEILLKQKDAQPLICLGNVNDIFIHIHLLLKRGTSSPG